MPLKTCPLWHVSQSRVLWGVSRLNPVAAAWLQVTAVQAIGRWQVWQSGPSFVLKRSSGLRIQWQS